ncbi:MAG: hypothetical protein ACOZAA_13315 [Pseudomonadota bacterium]
MPTDTETDATAPTPESTTAPTDETFIALRGERLPFPPRVRRFRFKTPRTFRKALRTTDRQIVKAVERLAETPVRRRRASIAGAVALNAGMLLILAIYGRVQIFVPNKPAESISVVYVDLPASPPVLDLRNPDIAPEPEPEPVVEPEITPEPEPEPVPEPQPPAESEPKPEPVIDLTPEPVFAPPSDVEEAPMIPDEEATHEIATAEVPLPGDITVEGEQAPAEEAPPLVAIEPEARQAEAETDVGEEEEKGEEEGAGEVAVGEQEAIEQAPAPAAEPLAGDDAFDEEPVFNGRRLALPPVDLPKGETSAVPGTSGVVAIYCPEEFTDKEKIAECAGRPEIRSGWRPGASGEDFSKAAAVLKDRRKHGDFSNDDVTFGPELARQAEERRRIEDLEDFRKKQDLGNAGIAQDPASGSRPDLVPPAAEPSWTRRDDSLVDKGDVEKLRKELDEAEKSKSIPDE